MYCICTDLSYEYYTCFLAQMEQDLGTRAVTGPVWPLKIWLYRLVTPDSDSFGRSNASCFSPFTVFMIS